mmetsp:Transcript_48908/g.56347  ORF Transcript_48908/g.56347 Transcript_48908/m.56347 type:complete len:738 (-) Transcript_48908:225-2438(-)|eukprot:CAMPEP_0176437568 /NCGR_PEP_ID=MMETSP0127-20121128/18712_1 /TAXON_ID=938130 /ORGANISM="Platyophrya macrostoma, Strain WH" /LENGTH=737 /DNA_ID=CAMNT_0017821245 /DNA_START=36 /DNA_END=2249 /DNA_ORIENTATION=+
MQNVIVLDGLPDGLIPSKHDLFRNHLHRLLKDKLGHTNYVLNFAIDESTGLVVGAFVLFTKQEEAERALSLLNRLPLTKTNVISTYRWSTLESIKAPLDEYATPVRDDEVSTEVSNAMMEDPLARPMLMMKYGAQCDAELYWWDSKGSKLDLFKKPNNSRSDHMGFLTELDRTLRRPQPGLLYGMNVTTMPLPTWTPYGTMLVAQHTNGLTFHGGPNFASLFSIEEENIVAFQISPMENYLIVKTDKEVSVWDLKKSKKLKILAGFDLTAWPVAKFNANDELVAFVKDGLWKVFRTKDMTLIRGSASDVSATMSNPTLKDFEWSPRNPLQVAFVFTGSKHEGWKVQIDSLALYESDDVADSFTKMVSETLIRRNFMDMDARISKRQQDAERDALMKWEEECAKHDSKKEAPMKPRPLSTDLNLLWHPEGNSLCAKVTRIADDQEVINYCLFRAHGKTYSADHFEIEKAYQCGRFAWQPAGKYFAMILLDKTNRTTLGDARCVLRFYAIDNKGVKQVGTHVTSATSLHWAPKGARLVAANYSKSQLEFYCINDNGVSMPLEKSEHPMLSATQWDPTGRYFASWTSVVRGAAEGGRYRIFDMNGRMMFEGKNEKADKFSHLAWRPLAKPVLSEEEVREVRHNLKDIIAGYEAADAAEKLEHETKERSRRERHEREWRDRMEAIHKHATEKGWDAERQRLRESAPWYIRHQETLRAAAAENRMVTEESVETFIKSREECK